MVSMNVTISSVIFVLTFISSVSIAAATASSALLSDDGLKNDLFPEILRDEAVARLYELGKVSDADGYLERTFLSPASIRAGNLIRTWMEDAGLTTWMDGLGNVHGRIQPPNASNKALLLGSHLDTVVDAGMFDGALGVISAISALKVLNVTGRSRHLKHPVEVIAFCDEEGVRFQSTFLGSAAIAGVLPVSTLQVSDKSGLTVQNVLKENLIDTTEENLSQLKYEADSVLGYVEVHIEQGPVLEAVGLPLAVVKGIAGQTRIKLTVRGSQGHAGTVPMSMRQDPMVAAAELIVSLESLCKRPQDYISSNGPDGQCNAFSIKSIAGSLVCTVGEISTWPSASNVIPGQASTQIPLVSFTIDIRTIDDIGREAIIYELSNQMDTICDRRSVSCIMERKHDANAVSCDAGLNSQLKSAAYAAIKRMTGEDIGDVPVLMSGAGHDAMAMSHLTKIGMLFVRCRGGISHSPEEHVLEDDVWAAGLAIHAFLDTNLLYSIRDGLQGVSKLLSTLTNSIILILVLSSLVEIRLRLCRVFSSDSEELLEDDSLNFSDFSSVFHGDSVQYLTGFGDQCRDWFNVQDLIR
ncbi:allantoate deiminase 2 [Tanacetum coccineum]|uniref:Allantoate deiminase 2 n=1 Tax=Tanacetum coccineum TaxID=301880 RepID=A0ABQ4XUR1_9ASTR